MKKIIIFFLYLSFFYSYLFSDTLLTSKYNDYLESIKEFGADHKITKEKFNDYINATKENISEKIDNIKENKDDKISKIKDKYKNYKENIVSKINKLFNIDIKIKNETDIDNFIDQILFDTQILEESVHKTNLEDSKARYLLAKQYYIMANLPEFQNRKDEFISLTKFHLNGAIKNGYNGNEKYPENKLFAQKSLTFYKENIYFLEDIDKELYEKPIISTKPSTSSSNASSSSSSNSNKSNLLTSSKGYIYPTQSGRISSAYGMRIHPIYKTEKMHNGIDIGVPEGTKLLAVDSGVVEFSGWMNGYGNVVILKASNGDKIYYAHNKTNLVKVGDTISAGTSLALANSTGLSTGSHLHFEVRRNNKSIDPSYYLGTLPVGSNIK